MRMSTINIILALSMLGGCRDERQVNPITIYVNDKNSNTNINASNLFDKTADHICIVVPGGKASTAVNTMLGRSVKDFIPIQDPEEFGEYLWKIVIVHDESSSYQLYTLHKQDFRFEFQQCVGIDNATLHFRVGIGDPPKKDNELPFFDVLINTTSGAY